MGKVGKADLLMHLPTARLRALADAFSVQADRRSKDALVEAFVRYRKLSTASLFGGCTADDLRVIAVQRGVSLRSANKAQMIEALLAESDPLPCRETATLAASMNQKSPESTVRSTTLTKRKKTEEAEDPNLVTGEPEEQDPDAEVTEGDEPTAQDTLICALTGEFKPDKPEERVLQSLLEQLHREYLVELSDMERDVRISCVNADDKKKNTTVGIAVYEHGKPHELENVIRVVLIAKANAKVSDAAIDQLDLVLSNLSEERAEVYGVWTNGKEMAFPFTFLCGH